MLTEDTSTPARPFSDFIVTLLLAGPAAAGAVPRDARTQAELRALWGLDPRTLRATWQAHEPLLRAAAATRGIAPRFAGYFFAESFGPKGTHR